MDQVQAAVHLADTRSLLCPQCAVGLPTMKNQKKG